MFLLSIFPIYNRYIILCKLFIISSHSSENFPDDPLSHIFSYKLPSYTLQAHKTSQAHLNFNTFINVADCIGRYIHAPGKSILAPNNHV